MRHYRSGLIAVGVLLAAAVVVAALLTATRLGEARRSPGSAAAAKDSATMKSGKRGPGSGSGTSTPTPDSRPTPSGINWGNPEFVDNFNGNELDLSHWGIYDTPYGSAPSYTPYSKQSVKVAGGYLNLIGRYQAPYGYVAGGVGSKIQQTYGRWVIRFRCDNGAGFEPAVLLWPEGGHADGEIDIAEVFPGTAQPVSTNRRGGGQFLHAGVNNVFIGNHIPFSVNFSDWHTVAVDWLPNHITMWIDGKKTWTVGRKVDGMDFIPNTPFHLALQLDEGCTRYRCKPDSATPAQVVMQVDWVKVYAAPRGAK